MKQSRLLSKSVAVLVAGLALGAVAHAADAPQEPARAPVSAKSLTAFKSMLESRYPGTPFKSVEETPLPGIFQVTMGREVAYVNEDGRYFLFNAHLFDMKTQTDLTKPAIDRAQSIDFKTLPLKDAVKSVKGNGKRVVAVFTDPDCPYCRQLEASLDKLTDATVYRFIFPIEGLHKGVTEKSKALWCAGSNDASRLDALRAYMGGAKKADGAANCANPIDRNVELAKKLGINGTPTMIASDGRMLPGYLPTDRLSAWLDGEAVR